MARTDPLEAVAAADEMARTDPLEALRLRLHLHTRSGPTSSLCTMIKCLKLYIVGPVFKRINSKYLGKKTPYHGVF
jgi:hypothetical protein